MAKAQKLTKTLIDDLALATDGVQYIVMDTATPGFGIRVGSQSKTFLVVKRIVPNMGYRIGEKLLILN